MESKNVEIKKLGINGEGIGYIDKKICFINNAFPGEIVDVEILEETKKFYKAKVINYVKKSPERIDSVCKEDSDCLGCAFTCINYKQQLPYKKGILKDAFKKYTSYDVEKLPVKAMVESPVKLGYKKVVSLPMTYFKGRVSAGIYQRETKYLTLMNQCSMQSPLINEVLVKIEDILEELGVRDYNDKVKKGLRFIRIREIEGQIQVLFVTGEDGISHEVVDAVSQIKEVVSIFFTINTTRHQDFDLQGFKKVYGVSTLSYPFQGQNFVYSMKSQFPTNIEMETKKIEIIQKMIPISDKVISLNCGVGLLELSIDNQVVAIDEKNYHIKDAKDNAKFLHKENVNFICKGINEGVVSQCKKKPFDTMVVRIEEMSDAIKQSIVLAKIKNVIYVSDHPSSIARDIEDLSRYYNVEAIIPLDTYPYSSKGEAIIQLKRK